MGPCPSSPVLNSPPSLPDMLPTPSIPSVVVSRCNPKSPRRNGSTPEPPIVSRRSWPRKEPPPSSRELVPTPFVPSVLLWFWSCIPKSPPPSLPRSKYSVMRRKKAREREITRKQKLYFCNNYYWRTTFETIIKFVWRKRGFVSISIRSLKPSQI